MLQRNYINRLTPPLLRDLDFQWLLCAGRVFSAIREQKRTALQTCLSRFRPSHPAEWLAVIQDFPFEEHIRIQTTHPDWGAYAGNLLQHGWSRPRNGRDDDKAHPPIHPTKSGDHLPANSDEKKVYELVARHYLACVSDNAQGSQTKVKIDIAGEMFNASGLMVSWPHSFARTHGCPCR